MKYSARIKSADPQELPIHERNRYKSYKTKGAYESTAQWIRNKVKEDGRLRDNITIALGRKNKAMVAQRYRIVGTEVVEARKEELKEASKEWK